MAELFSRCSPGLQFLEVLAASVLTARALRGAPFVGLRGALILGSAAGLAPGRSPGVQLVAAPGRIVGHSSVPLVFFGLSLSASRFRPLASGPSLYVAWLGWWPGCDLWPFLLVCVAAPNKSKTNELKVATRRRVER